MALTDSELITGWVPEDTFASRLALIRNARGLTQVEAAALCNLDDGSWSNWERGAKPRGMDQVVQKIVAGLKVDRDWLMWGDGKCPECAKARSRCFCASDQRDDGEQLELEFGFVGVLAMAS